MTIDNGRYRSIKDTPVAKGWSRRGVLVAGTARGSGEFTTLSTTEVAITFDPTLLNDSSLGNPSMIVLQIRSDVALRVSEEEDGTDDNTAYFPIDADTAHPEFIILRANDGIFLRTDAAASGTLFYQISVV